MRLSLRRRTVVSGEGRANWMRARGVLIALLVGGLAVIYGAHETLAHDTLGDVLVSLGEGLLVAGILGLTVDALFKKELARDAFEAGLGYPLPEAMRGEMRWMLGQNLLCVEHDQRFALKPDGDKVRLDIDLCSRLRNVGPRPYRWGAAFELDEWFEEDAPSAIRSLEVVHGARRLDRPRVIESCKHRVGRALPQIQIAPGEEVVVHCAGHEMKTRNGSYVHTTTLPLSRPTVHMEACDGIGIEVEFGNSGPVEHIGGRWQLNATLLPHQAISVRWWDVKAAAAHTAKQA